MAVLALLQRVSLLKFSKLDGETANSFKGNGKISPAEINNVLALHEEYVRCQNQILLFEVTSQEQGIEIFELFLEQLYIEREKYALETQLNNLYEIASGNYERLNLRQDKMLNLLVGVFAVVSVVIAILQLNFSNQSMLWVMPLSIGIPVFAVIIVIVLWFLIYRD